MSWLVEILPTNPHLTAREFIPSDLIERLYLEGDGRWGALLRDGKWVAVHPNSVPSFDEEVPK